MKILAALSYAIAVAGGSGALLNSAMLAFFVFLGVIFTLLAIERIVQDAVKPVRSRWPRGGQTLRQHLEELP